MPALRGVAALRAAIRQKHNISNKPRKLYVYDIETLTLVNKTSYLSFSDCVRDLNMNRTTINKYLDTENILKYKYLFSSTELNNDYLIKLKEKGELNNIVLEAITGDLLGDGHIRLSTSQSSNKNQSYKTGRLEFTFSTQNLMYLNYLKFNIYKSICTKTKGTPYPKDNPTQYWFSTKKMPIFLDIHSKWYITNPEYDMDLNNIDVNKKVLKYIKILPDNIYDLITPISIAHWIMGDGYFTGTTSYICTDNFTKNEVIILQKIFKDKFNIDVKLKTRWYTLSNNEEKISYRLKILPKDLNKLILLIKPHVITEMYYKLGFSHLKPLSKNPALQTGDNKLSTIINNIKNTISDDVYIYNMNKLMPALRAGSRASAAITSKDNVYIYNDKDIQIFNSKKACMDQLGIKITNLNKYLYTDIIYDNKFIFSTVKLEPKIIAAFIKRYS